MKKLFTILCLSAITIIASAQIQFGPVLGFNLSNVVSSDAFLGINTPGFIDERSSATGMHFGGVITFPLSDLLLIKTGLIYSQKGGGEKLILDQTFSGGGGATGSLGFDYNLDYLEIPVDVAFKLGDEFTLSAGPYIAIVMNKSVDVTATGLYYPDYGSGSELDTDINEIFDKSVKGLDMGLNLGASYTIAERYIFSTKYSIGLTDILDPETPTGNIFENNLISDADWTNGCLSFSFGYIFYN